MTHTEPAFAKLNLTLDILGKREDGYHDMRMVMQSIDLHDVVTITPREKAGLTLTTDLPFLPKGRAQVPLHPEKAILPACHGVEGIGAKVQHHLAKLVWSFALKFKNFSTCLFGCESSL